ncbi:hypothetical protein DT019_08640 [Streptomyces sp. SDr-06]|nr:hypothetical protein DT019_08640 [Streptomyces sp. SDr-06]
MALYAVSRTDDVQPGEFVSALVIAGGAAQARNAVRHFEGVTAKNVQAKRTDVVADVSILSTYFDEREPAQPDTLDAFPEF